MAISYNAGTNLITLDDDVGAGDSWTNAFDMDDVLAADVAGAWGVVTKQGANAYDVSARMHFAAGVYFVSKNEFVELKPNPTNPTYAIDSIAGSHIRMGEYDATNKFSHNGSYWKMFLGATTSTKLNRFLGETLIYASKWWMDSTSHRDSWNFNGKTRIYDSIMTGLAYFNVADIDIQNIIWDGRGATYCMLLAYGYNFNWKGIVVSNTSYGLYLSSAAAADAAVYDVVFNGCTTDAMASHTTWLLNVVNSPTLSTTVVAAGMAGIKECYTFNVKVTDDVGNAIVGATVELKDVDNNVVFSEDTAAGGVLTADKIVVKYWYRNAAQGGNKDYNPFTLTIIESGYITYETVITIDHEIKSDQIVLRRRKREGVLRY